MRTHWIGAIQPRECLLTGMILLMAGTPAPAATRFVDLNSATPAAPFLSWNTAATNIQDAIDVAVAGDDILVTNGLYSVGRQLLFNALLFRIAVSKPVAVRSVNGPEHTIIRGETRIGCAYLTNGAFLSGFTLTNGIGNDSGGGVVCVSGNSILGSSAVVSNCLITGNSSPANGGGASGGTLLNCRISHNYASDGGGGVSASRLYNCVLEDNFTPEDGGGAFLCTLNNCTVVRNTAYRGGGVSNCSLTNSIVYFNAGNFPNYTSSSMEYSCTTPLPAGTGNISADPRFVNAAGHDYRLGFRSPCIDAGSISSVLMHDLDGRVRPQDGNRDGCAGYDMGAFENPPPLFIGPGDSLGDFEHPIELVVVSNGVYTAANGSHLVALRGKVRMESLNGPEATILDAGGVKPCVLMEGGILSGFTVRNGRNTNLAPSALGGGIAGAPASIIVRCIIENNGSSHGGGGVSGGVLYNCIIRSNRADHFGGGAYQSTLFNCLLSRNVCDGYGGGAAGSTLYHCTVVENSSDDQDSGCCGGGAWGSTLFNSIAHLNHGGNELDQCFAQDTWPGGGGSPLFVNPAAQDYRLQPGSPCIDAGGDLGALIPLDMDDLRRPLEGNRDGDAAPDMGAFEFNPLFFTSITHSNGNVQLHWFDSVPGMKLQSASTLINPFWRIVPYPPGTNAVEISAAASPQFFRLVLP